MRTLFIFLLLAGVASGFSQTGPAFIPQLKYSTQPKISFGDFMKKLRDASISVPSTDFNSRYNLLIDTLRRPPQKQSSPIDNMPNAIAMYPYPSANSVYKGNNGLGFDMYESKIDRMPVLMPDSTNDAVIRKKIIKN